MNQAIYQRVLALLQDDDVWLGITDDAAATLTREEGARMIANLTTFSGRDDLVFLLVQRNAICVEFHTIAGKTCRGKDLIAGTQEMIDYLFKQGIEKVFTLVPATNRAAKIICRKGGMVEEGVLTKSIKRNNELVDQHIYSYIKGE